jgi:excisionase family DNA binding protein
MDMIKAFAVELYQLLGEDLRLIIRQEIHGVLIDIPNIKESTSPYLTVKEACNYLKLSRNSLTKLAIEYNINAHQIRGKKYYLRKDLDQIFKT